jgi:integrase
MVRLSDRAIKAAGPGRHGDGDGLFLEVSAKGSKSWLLRFQLAGKRRDMGLGRYPEIGLADARRAAAEARALIARGADPIEERESNRRRERPVPTFREVAVDVITEMQARSTNEKVRYQAARHLGPVYSGPLLDRPVNEITTVDVAAVLRPVWRQKPEVARKLYPAIRRVFEAARIRLRDEHGIAFANPALWADLRALGFEQPKALSRGSHPSLPYTRMPEFMSALREHGGVAGRLLEYLVLTNTRTGTALAAEWREIDLDAALWIVPAEKLKDAKHRKEPFRIPLSPRAIAILREMEALKASRYIFPGAKGRPLSNMTMLVLLKRMNGGETKWIDPAQNRPITVHGFRASFKTWAEEVSHFPHSVVEEAMGHVVGNAVERVYRRTDVLEQRRALMMAWAIHCEPKPANVLAFERRGM